MSVVKRHYCWGIVVLLCGTVYYAWDLVGPPLVLTGLIPVWPVAGPRFAFSEGSSEETDTERHVAASSPSPAQAELPSTDNGTPRPTAWVPPAVPVPEADAAPQPSSKTQTAAPLTMPKTLNLTGDSDLDIVLSYCGQDLGWMVQLFRCAIVRVELPA